MGAFGRKQCAGRRLCAVDGSRQHARFGRATHSGRAAITGRDARSAARRQGVPPIAQCKANSDELSPKVLKLKQEIDKKKAAA